MEFSAIIQKKLKEIELESDIEILLAVESGSRAWGFPSKDSDYDVRFIYRHKLKWYLKLDKPKDTLEFPINDELDISGWDLDKTLVLLRKTNPALIEWLNSPIKYYVNEEFHKEISELYEKHVNEKSLIYHYLHMASGNYRDYLKGEEVKIKKYFYVLRPILACMWIEKYNQKPPVLFDELLTLPDLSKEFLATINELLVRKKNGDELDIEPSNPVLNDFIKDKMKHFEEYAAKAQEQNSIDYEDLNEFFFHWISV